MMPRASRSDPPRLPATPSDQRYVIGLGSNRPHGRHGAPEAVLLAALFALDGEGLRVEARSAIHSTLPLGPGGRRYANGVALIRTPLSPLALLHALKRVEQAFGRRPGRRWGARVLDLDILLWSGGAWRQRTLWIPHREVARRHFVLDPLLAIAPDWRVAGPFTVRHVRHRLTRPVPLHRGSRTVGL